MRTPTSLRFFFLSTAAACAVSACGGGSDAPAAPVPPRFSPCSALQDGTYRVIVPQAAAAGEYATDTMTINAVTGVTTSTSDPTDVGQLTSTGNCTYNGGSGGELVVSSGGVVVFRSQEGGAMRLGLAFREQTIALADLAGTWQSVGFERVDTSPTYAAVYAVATLSATGAWATTTYCPGVKTCLTNIPPASVNLSSNARGGFNLVNTTEGWTDRVFAYRAASGDLMLAALANNGSFSLWTQQRNNAPPAVGSRSANWGLWANPSLVSTAVASQNDFTTLSVNTVAGSWTRQSNIDGHNETLFANNPHPGLTFRAEGTALATTGPAAGTNVVVREFAALNLRGIGISALSMPNLGGGAYFLSVTTP